MDSNGLSSRKTIGPKLDRHWNTPGDGELKWISISTPLPTEDTKYGKILETRGKLLSQEENYTHTGLTQLRLNDHQRRQQKLVAISGNSIKTRNVKKEDEKKTWTVNVQEKQYERNAFFDKKYEGDLFSTRGDYTKSFVYRSRHNKGSCFAVIGKEDDSQNDKTNNNKANVALQQKNNLTKSQTDSIKALHEISKNVDLHTELIDENGYDSVIDIMYTIPTSQEKLYLLCGEFLCNISDNLLVNSRILPKRVVESLIYCASYLESNLVFLCRVSRSLVNLSASKISTESLVWQKGIATLIKWSKYDEIITESLHKCLFNIVTSSTYKILPWFRECASLAVKMFKEQSKFNIDVQIILLRALSHLASFASLANALIGLLLIGKLRERVNEIITNKTNYLMLGERVQLLEWIVKIIYNMSRAIDACSKMSDENINVMLDDILDFLHIGQYSEECVNLILGALGNIGRSPHARCRLIPQGSVLILKKACLACVKHMKKMNNNAVKYSNETVIDGKRIDTNIRLGNDRQKKVIVYGDRLRICVEGLLHYTSDKAFILDTFKQGSLHVLCLVCDMTNNKELLYTAFTTACDIISSKTLSSMYEHQPKDIQHFIEILFKQINNKTLRINDENDPLGYIATALRNITLNSIMVEYIATVHHPLAEMAIELAYRSFHDESILVLCAAVLYNSTKNVKTIKALYSYTKVRKIIYIMKSAKTPRVDELCLATLQNITHAFESAGKVYQEGGAIEELIELAMSRDQNIRGLAVSVLCTLTYDDSNAKMLVKENTLETLVEVAKISTMNASRISAAFNNFACMLNGAYISKLIEIDAISVLVNMLSSGKQHVRSQAAQALCHIACFSHYNYLALPLVPNIICRSANTSTYWRAVVAACGVEQLVLTGLLRNSAESTDIQEFCCVGFYTLISKAGVLHPLNKNIAWAAGKMYQLRDMCKDMANRILINLSKETEGRVIIEETECLTEAARALMNMSMIDESNEIDAKDCDGFKLNMMVNICDIFYNVMTAKKARINGNGAMLEALLLFGNMYGKFIDFHVRRRLIDLYCILGSTKPTAGLFVTSRGFLILDKLYAFDKKIRRSKKMDVEESKEMMKRGVIAAYSASTSKPEIRILAGTDGALERLLEFDPKLFDVATKKLVVVGIYNFSIVDNTALRHIMAKRGGLKLCRELLEITDIDKMVFMNRQRIFSRMAYLLSQADEGLKLILIEKGIMRMLLACSLTKDPGIANEVATSLCNFSQILTGLVHLVHGRGLQATKNIIQNGARNYFNPKSSDSYEKCAIALSNMACHKNSQPKLVREGIVSMFQRLSGGKSVNAIDACAKGIAAIGMNAKACTSILVTRGVINNLIDWYESARNQNGPSWRNAEACIAFTIHQADLNQGIAEEKFQKDELYAVKAIKKLDKEILSKLSLMMTMGNEMLRKLLNPPLENEVEKQHHEVFTKHNRLPNIQIIYDEQSSIKWKEQEYSTHLIVPETLLLQEEPSYQISWSNKKLIHEMETRENHEALKHSIPTVLEIRNSLYQQTSTMTAIQQFTYINDKSFYEEMAQRLTFIEDTNRKVAIRKQLVQCIKTLAIVSYNSHVKEALHLERERIFKLEEAIQLKRLEEKMASEARKPLVSPTRRPKVVSFTKLPKLLKSNTALKATKNSIAGVRQIVRTIEMFKPKHCRERRERNTEQHKIVSDYLRESNATPGTTSKLKGIFGVTTPLKQTQNEILLNNQIKDDIDVDVAVVETVTNANTSSQLPIATPELIKIRNKQQHFIINDYLNERDVTPDTTLRLKATFGVTTPSHRTDVSTATVSIKTDDLDNNFISTSTSVKSGQIEIQVRDDNLLYPRVEPFEFYQFGSYTRKYYN